MRLLPGGGSGGGRGFFAWVDASALTTQPLVVDFAYEFRGNASLSLIPQAGDTRWSVKSSWPSPSFGGDFLPGARVVSDKGFDATYRVGNLALGRSLVSTGDPGASNMVEKLPVANMSYTPAASPGGDAVQAASISLIRRSTSIRRSTERPIRLPFIGFTFLALLMFDVIGGVQVSAVEYLLMGAALVLFFVLLLAFAEVIGFTPAYVLASAAIAGLNTAYSAAVLGSWRRAKLHRGIARRALRSALRPPQPRGLFAADRLAAALRGAGRGDVRDAPDRLGCAADGGCRRVRDRAKLCR